MIIIILILKLVNYHVHSLSCTVHVIKPDMIPVYQPSESCMYSVCIAVYVRVIITSYVHVSNLSCFNC